MSQRIVVKSFADLALVLKLEDLPAEPTTEAPATPAATATQDDPPNLARLLADLEAAGATLAEMARRDEERRAQARRDLDTYDAMVASQREAEQARDRAQQVREQAEALAQTGFTEEVQATAAGIAETARRAETTATAMAEQRRVDAERLAGQPDIQRLLAERRRQEEAEQARREKAERASRVAEAVEAGRAALQAGRLTEAQVALEAAALDAPDHPDVQDLRRRLARREFAARVTLVEDTLWQARRAYRHDPAAAVADLERLDIDDLPDPLARQVFGAWARACLRLCRDHGIVQPLRYAPRPGRGVVIARSHTDGCFVVVSALGMGDGWRVGAAVSGRVVQCARPLH